MNPGEQFFNLIDDLKREIAYLREEIINLRKMIEKSSKRPKIKVSPGVSV